jgi:hypothetical protein
MRDRNSLGLHRTTTQHGSRAWIRHQFVPQSMNYNYNTFQKQVSTSCYSRRKPSTSAPSNGHAKTSSNRLHNHHLRFCSIQRNVTSVNEAGRKPAQGMSQLL